MAQIAPNKSIGRCLEMPMDQTPLGFNDNFLHKLCNATFAVFLGMSSNIGHTTLLKAHLLVTYVYQCYC